MMMNLINRLIDDLTKHQEKSGMLNVCIGFDGYVDEIMRVVKSKKGLHDYELFDTITDFSKYIQNSAGKSSDTELLSREIRFGGNAPLMANALASLGLSVSLIGTLGKPKNDPAFEKMNRACRRWSVGDPGYSYSFEFDDGKLMFGKIATLDDLTWNRIKSQIGLEPLKEIFTNSKLLSFVNWSSIYHMNEILTGIGDEILSQIDSSLLQQKVFFFDIADPSRRTQVDLLNFLDLLSNFSKYSPVILGLNEREARSVAQSLGRDLINTDLGQLGHFILSRLAIDTLVIHGLDSAISVRENELHQVSGFYVAHPKISTGGGDNFNAGFCLGKLFQLDSEEMLLLGNSIASYYIQNGVSPSLDQIIGFLKQQRKAVND
jgi:sugar/nucleoside kinase (ribokinase family)